MAYRVYQDAKTGKYEIEECAASMVAFNTIEQAQSSIARLVKRNATLTPPSDYDNAIHGIPSEKSLKNLPAKLAAIRRAEEIENGDETL